MKNLNFKLIFVGALLGLCAVTSSAQAEATTTIQMKVVAFDQVLFNSDFAVVSCPDDASSTNNTLNAWCATSQLVLSQGWTATSTWYPYGVMLNSINQYVGSDVNYWLWFSNSEPGETALNQHIVSGNEKLLLAFGTSPLKITASSTSQFINSTTTLSAFYFDALSWQWLPSASSTFSINGQDIASADGTYKLWTSTTTPYAVLAKKSGFIDSEPLAITSQLPTINIKLRIETASSTLFNDDFTVSSCPDDASTTNYTLNAWCATSQLVSNQGWTATSTWYSFGVILNAINQYDGSDGNYWLWFENLEYGQTALNKHELAQDENLLIAYGKYPLRLATTTATPYVNSTSTLTLEEFGFDEGWNPVWSPAASSTFSVNGQESFSADGILQLFIATTGPYSVFGRKPGFLDSPTTTLTGVLQDNSQSPSSNNFMGMGPAANNDNPINIPTHRTVDVDKAVGFLIANQNADGSIGSSVLYSDWSALALASWGNSEAKNKLKNYLINAAPAMGSESPTTDWERRAMALMALGVNPYNGSATNYIERIVLVFDNKQIGDPALFNDDIFALFPLLKAGYSATRALAKGEDESLDSSATRALAKGEDESLDSSPAEPIIDAAVKFIISKQEPNGSWGSVDLTAAAAQALVLSQKTGSLNAGIAGSINLARSFLRSSQGANGGFGNNVFSTSWVIQALAALGEQVSAWENNGNNPIDFLASLQNSDGGFEDSAIAKDTRIWATAYAVPAALNKTWEEILGSFPKQIQSSPQNAGLSVINVAPPLENATSATSSVSATSTDNNVAQATSTTSLSEPSLPELPLPELPIPALPLPVPLPPEKPAATTTPRPVARAITPKIQTKTATATANSVQQKSFSPSLVAQVSQSAAPVASLAERVVKLVASAPRIVVNFIKGIIIKMSRVVY